MVHWHELKHFANCKKQMMWSMMCGSDWRMAHGIQTFLIFNPMRPTTVDLAWWHHWICETRVKRCVACCWTPWFVSLNLFEFPWIFYADLAYVWKLKYLLGICWCQLPCVGGAKTFTWKSLQKNVMYLLILLPEFSFAGHIHTGIYFQYKILNKLNRWFKCTPWTPQVYHEHSISGFEVSSRQVFFSHERWSVRCPRLNVKDLVIRTDQWSLKTMMSVSSWWFQPLWKILVKMGIFPK